MIKEIRAKKILSNSKYPDPWFGIKYNMNIYRGCQHSCIYCDSRSQCYQIDNFEVIHVKINAVELLKKELQSKREKGTVGTGSMSDPYIPLEKEFKLTRKALKVIAGYHFPVHMITKSDLVVRDKDILQDINRIYGAVSFTITTSDDNLAKKIEPGAPRSSDRFKAMKILADAGVYTGLTMMPILPFIEDNEDNIRDIVENAASHGAKYIIPGFGMTLRDRQRAHYYKQLDKLFPEVRKKYEGKYGNQYGCSTNNADELMGKFKELCSKYDIKTRMNKYEGDKSEQLSLF
ncbi:radical SAM protein [Wukongibacter baidiensis]|uniref:SPL family radical SAM protein n=1 Tax=Wukongibacter baidiensis TaxID=1723361 RepID=UPI003D7F5319